MLSTDLKLRSSEQDVEVNCGPVGFHIRALCTEDLPALTPPGGNQVVVLPGKAFVVTAGRAASSASGLALLPQIRASSVG